MVKVASKNEDEFETALAMTEQVYQMKTGKRSYDIRLGEDSQKPVLGHCEEGTIIAGKPARFIKLPEKT